MKTEIITIPLKMRSKAADYTCQNGEIDSFSNIYPGCLPPGSSGSSNDEEKAPFIMMRPPSPGVEFNLKRTVLPGWHQSPLSLPTIKVEAPDNSVKTWKNRAAELLDRFTGAADNASFFTSPFLVMTTLRLKDGTHISPSPPVLMIPNSEAPWIIGEGDLQGEAMEMSIAAAVCRLQCRVTLPEEMEEWENTISHLDLFVSAPIPLYDPKTAFSLFHRRSFSGFSHSLTPDGMAGEHPVCSDTFSRGWIPSPHSEVYIRNFISGIKDFHLISSISLRDITESEEFTDVDFNCGATPMVASGVIYQPDFRHLARVEAAGDVTFSGRRTIFDLTVTPPPFLPLSAHTPFCNVAGYLPRFIFHPYRDSTVFPTTIAGQTVVFPLTPHSRMAGAFMLRSLSTNSPLPSAPSTVTLPSQIRLPNAVWRSERTAGIHFPDSLFFTLDTSRILHIQRAFRSSGLVATTSPTAYLFSAEGIYLLKEMADGSFRDAGMISTHVLGESGSIRLEGDSLCFTSADGEHLIIKGTAVKNVGTNSSGNSESPAWYSGGGNLSFSTRPIKLGNPEHPRHLISMILRGSFNPDSFTLTLEGSYDLNHWHFIASGRRGGVRGLWGIRFPFLRVKFKGEASEGDSFSVLVAEVIPSESV